MTDGNGIDPKRAAARFRVPVLTRIPPVARRWHSVAHEEGALKYGPYNWRKTRVKASTYVDAACRHLDKFSDGQLCDTMTGVPHLASVMASCAILLDAFQNGTLEWDLPTPPEFNFGLERADAERAMKLLHSLYGDKT